MSRVPPPPEPEKREQASSPIQHKPPKKRTQLAAPLDAGFLGRVYVTTLWLGLIWTACAWAITRSPTATGSFAGGVILGALLLKSQEIFVRRILAPRAEVVEDGAPLKIDFVARIPIALLLPLKYVVIGLAFAFVIERDWLHPIAFTVGFLTEQIIIVSRIVGRLVTGQSRS